MFDLAIVLLLLGAAILMFAINRPRLDVEFVRRNHSGRPRLTVRLVRGGVR
jgi:hypothetical protein